MPSSQAEWLDSPQQMRLLPKEAWQRLALPVGLEAELQRRLDCAVKAGGVAGIAGKVGFPMADL